MDKIERESERLKVCVCVFNFCVLWVLLPLPLILRSLKLLQLLFLLLVSLISVFFCVSSFYLSLSHHHQNPCHTVCVCYVLLSHRMILDHFVHHVYVLQYIRAMYIFAKSITENSIYFGDERFITYCIVAVSVLTSFNSILVSVYNTHVHLILLLLKQILETQPTNPPTNRPTTIVICVNKNK